MDAYAAQLRRQMDATCAAMAATLTRMLIRVARLGCRGTWERLDWPDWCAVMG
jgi:hypothetical protein